MMTSIENIPTGFYVYRHTFSNGRVYIGKGKDARYCDFRMRSEFWKRNYGKYGDPDVVIIDMNLDEVTAFELEEFCIQEYLDTGYTLGDMLINFTIGGEGASGYSHTEEAKVKISEAAVKMWDKDGYKEHMSKKLSEYCSSEEGQKTRSRTSKEMWENKEYRENKIVQLKEMWQDPEHIDAMSKRMTGSKNPAAKRANIYTYPEGLLIAGNVVSAEWARDNGYSRPKLQTTSRSDRSEPSTATNPHHHKGVYMEYINE